MSERFDKARFDDDKMEAIMGRLLQVGVLLSSVFVLAGGVMYLWAHRAGVADYRVFAGEPAGLREIRGLMHSLAAGRASAIIQLGVLLLIATPIARVVFAAFSFAVERDRLYVAISLTVLAVLVFGLVHGS